MLPRHWKRLPQVYSVGGENSQILGSWLRIAKEDWKRKSLRKYANYGSLQLQLWLANGLATVH